MESHFAQFEQRIQRVAERHPDMPLGNVVLTRMFFYVSRALEESANRFLAEYGLNNTHYIALMMIYASDGNMLNPCALSSALQSSRANMTRVMDELTEHGWVERQGSAEDRRRIELSLTPAGFALLESILPRNWARVNDLWADFSVEEMELTGRLMRKLLSHIDPAKGGTDEPSCQA